MINNLVLKNSGAIKEINSMIDDLKLNNSPTAVINVGGTVRRLEQIKIKLIKDM